MFKNVTCPARHVLLVHRCFSYLLIHLLAVPKNTTWVVGEYFSEDERLFVVNRVDAVSGNDLRAKLAPNRVRRKSKHVHLDVCSKLPVGEKLAGDDLHTTVRYWSVYSFGNKIVHLETKRFKSIHARQ